MSISSNELNLSLTEFLYFQTCSQKFRIHRLLNPVPYPNNFMSSKRPLGSYFLRGYDQQTLEGLRYHAFFEQFHQKYFPIITNEEPPPEILADEVKKQFWFHEQQRYYEVDLECWFPHATEVSLMTKKQRGRIDCLVLCPEREGLKLIDYKSHPSPDDELSLIFYTQLVNNYRKEMNDMDFLDYDAIETSCYYYKSGAEKQFELRLNKIIGFNKKLEAARTQIASEEFKFQLDQCFSCQYKTICLVERKRRK